MSVCTYDANIAQDRNVSFSMLNKKFGNESKYYDECLYVILINLYVLLSDILTEWFGKIGTLSNIYYGL